MASAEIEAPCRIRLHDPRLDREVEAIVLNETAAHYRVNFSGKENADTYFEAGTGTTYVKKGTLENHLIDVIGPVDLEDNGGVL